MKRKEFTDEQKHIILHSLGLTDPCQKESYRNHYVTGELIPFDILVLREEGLMEEVPAPAFIGHKDRLFVVSDSGKAYAETIRVRLTKPQLRYRRFLDLKDCWPDLTFREFLKYDSENYCK